MKTIIYKVGGSLFSMPDLAARLREVLAMRPGTRPLLIAGGGPAADIVRDWDGIHNLGDEDSHTLAIHAMSLGEELLNLLLPEANFATNRAEAETLWDDGRIAILRTAHFLRNEERNSDNGLPHTWDATSDTIAAWIAVRWPVDELVLLKSVDIKAAATAVDPSFAEIAAAVGEVTWVNLREETPRLKPWTSRE